MGLRDLLTGNRPRGIGAQTPLALTEDGKKSCDQMMIKDRIAEAIMFALDEHSPQSLSSIVKGNNLSFHDAQRKAMQLQRQGLIRAIDHEMGGM